MSLGERRGLIDAVRSIPSRHRAWVAHPFGVEGFELFCYYGWGVVPNTAQLESAAAVFDWPPGAFHLWRFANRTGKTTGAVLLHTYICWRKWRYANLDFEGGWWPYRYRTLHAAPSGYLMSKAWELGESLIAGSAIQQRSDLTSRQRPGLFIGSGLWEAGKEQTAAQADLLVLRCANNAQVDLLQTRDDAARLESMAWWFIIWDEFVRHQPVGDIPRLVDQTFLPRSSDFLAPVVLSGTETDDSAPVYAELEAMAEHAPGDWNLMEFGRRVNFSQTGASIDRQIRMSLDSAVAKRSVEGGAGEGGRGALLPGFVLREAFDKGLEAGRTVADLPDLPDGRVRRVDQTFDHALAGDMNAVLTVATPWPILSPDDLLRHPAEVLDLVESSGHLAH